MSNIYLQAKLLWRVGKRQEGFSVLNEYLEKRLGQRIFWPADRVFKSQFFAYFEAALSALLSNSDMLVAPFGRVFSLLWTLMPAQNFVDILLQQDFYYQSNVELFDVEGEISLMNTEEDFEAVTTALTTAASKGTLGSDPAERPHGGRAILSVESVKQVPSSQWGPLKNMLLERLPAAYEDCPPDFWHRLATNEPEEVFVRFLYDLFFEFRPSLETAEMRWRGAVLKHNDYARAVCESVSTLVNKNYDPSWFTKTLQAEIDFTKWGGSTGWLHTLYQALLEEDFEKLDGFVVEAPGES